MSDTNVSPLPEEGAEKTGLSTAARRKLKLARRNHSRRFEGVAKSVTKGQIFTLDAALEKVKELANTKFNETVDIAVNLGVDPRHGDQMVRGTASLPHGTGKSRSVWVFARGERAEAALAAGADVVGAEDLVERIQKEGGASCDILVASTDVMPLVGRLGPILKQKMPNPKAGTVSPNVAQVVKEIKGATRVEYRVERNGIVHAAIGKAAFPVENLRENFLVLITALVAAKPSASKGKYLKKVSISSTMGPSITLDLIELAKLTERK